MATHDRDIPPPPEEAHLWAAAAKAMGVCEAIEYALEVGDVATKRAALRDREPAYAALQVALDALPKNRIRSLKGDNGVRVYAAGCEEEF